jgi:ATP-dependent Clp protease ATP-binding subunit ClpA
MFERFTDEARDVVRFAEEEARALNHEHIGPEHLLITVIGERRGIGGRVLRDLGLTVDTVREQVTQIVPRGDTMARGHVPFTPRAKKILELSLREALALGNNYIGTEHFVLGLVRASDTVALRVLQALALSAEMVRAEVIARVKAEAAELPAAVGEGPRSKTRRKGPPVPVEGAKCRTCGATLSVTARYQVVEVAEFQGDGKAEAMFLFCVTCGTTIDDVILPGA